MGSTPRIEALPADQVFQLQCVVKRKPFLAPTNKDKMQNLIVQFRAPRKTNLLHVNPSSHLRLRFLVFRVNKFWFQFIYFLILFLLGYLALKVSKPRSIIGGESSLFRPKDFDLFFTSVSAATVSSMSSVEMEVFSNTQLVILASLMLLGGEVFTSMLGLQLQFIRSKVQKPTSSSTTGNSEHAHLAKIGSPHQLELGTLGHNNPNPNLEDDHAKQNTTSSLEPSRINSIKFLATVVLCYLLVVHVVGSTLISIYVSLVPSARDVLKDKGIPIQIFSIFTVISSFGNCGFIPTNENMIVFIKNSGLLLLVVPPILLGNTLYAPCLRLVVSVLERFTKREDYLLKNTREVGYLHLLPPLHSSWLVVTVVGFTLVQFILFCSLEWGSNVLSGLSSYRKIVGVLFQTVNSRHTGETIVDLSSLSPAILVLFVVMMYLPPYTSFLPVKDGEQHPQTCQTVERRRGKVLENIIFSQLSFLVIFIIIVCITERKSMKEDPLNFNVLNIVIEVTSAYGNVGFSAGYSCARQLKPDGNCKDKWNGFSGK
ncbi:hypothetical protein NMG60_11030641 [Bertholletia excelsa]